jgi:hypothetical protein
MKRVISITAMLALVMAIAGYAGGMFTGEVRKEESCSLCRSIRYSGYHYGFPYSRVEDGPLTAWYRQNVDARHGLDPQTPHDWHQSACIVNVKPGFGEMQYSCMRVPPVFLLRPEILVDVFRAVPDKQTQIGLIRALNTTDRRAATRRVRLLIEYYYIDRADNGWARWWRLHAREFGLSPR